MQEQASTPLTQDPTPEPQVVTPPNNPTSNEVPGKQNKATLFVIIGIVVVLLVFAGVIVLLTRPTEETSSSVTTTASTEVKNTADLDKISQELDSADLDSYEADLQLNDSDATSF